MTESVAAWRLARAVPAERVEALARTLTALAEASRSVDGCVSAESLEYALCRFEIPLPSLTRPLPTAVVT